MSVPKLDPKTECWIWQGSISQGYGKLSNGGGGPEWAHRVYYELAYGPIPERQQIHHACENRACVNPAHLELLSPRAHGQKGTRAKLSIIQVREIRRRLIAGDRNTDLANEFGITRQTVCDIKAGRSWQDKVTCPNCSHSFDPYD